MAHALLERRLQHRPFPQHHEQGRSVLLCGITPAFKQLAKKAAPAPNQVPHLRCKALKRAPVGHLGCP